MALIIEDGTGKADAESFVTVAELEAFATKRGVVLPVTEAAKEALLVKAADYLIYREPEFQGLRSVYSQALPFPRSPLVINCQTVASTVVPVVIKQAQMQAALEAQKLKGDLSPSQTKMPVYKEKVDVIERQFMTPRQISTRPDGSVFAPTYPKVDAFLFGTLRGNECPTGQGSFLKLVRG